MVVLLFGVLTGPTSPAGAADRGLVGYWPMDEGTGNVLDELSSKSLSVKIGHKMAWRKTERGPALDFDGSKTSGFKIPTSPYWDYAPGVEGDLTIFFWVKAIEDGFILDHYFSGTPAAWAIHAEGQKLLFSMYDDNKTARQISFAGFQNVKWHHLALVWHRGANGWLKGYLDGKLVDAVDDVSCASALVDDTYVGAQSGSRNFFQGHIKELAIFNRVMPAPEIEQIYRDGVKLSASVVVSSLTVDKLLYNPHETGQIELRIRNVSDTRRQVTLTVELISSLARRRTLYQSTLSLAPQTSRLFRFDAPLDDLEYGCEVRVGVSEADKLLSEKREYFSVTDNFWKVGIGSLWGAAAHTARDESVTIPEKARRRYANWIELFFWSPGDWALHVAPAKLWWSGQTSYPQNDDNLKQLIKLSHREGIKVAMYASCNPAGPFGWEVARRHPEWFVDFNGCFPPVSGNRVEALENWNDSAWRKDRQHPGWIRLPVDLREQEALDYGIDQLIRGAKHYGWDAVRFDGHYTTLGSDDLSTANMRRLKERVWQELPQFRLGFNYGRAPEWKPGLAHEMREAMAGGGLFLQEGIRAWRNITKPYKSWQHYATNELRIAKLIQSWGGSYHCMWEVNHTQPVAQRYYKFVYGLIAGGHPMTGSWFANAPLCPSWGAFMTRWSSMLWHQRLRRAEGEEKNFTVQDAAVQWQGLLQEYVDSPSRKFVIQHLVNPPAVDEIEKSKELPKPLAAFDVTYQVQPGTKVTGVRLIAHNAMPFDRRLSPRKSPRGLSVSVPKLEHWAMLVWELEGSFQVPDPVPRFTEPADAAKVAAARQARVSTRVVDPNKRAVVVRQLEPNERIWETDSRFSGIPAEIGADNEATGGIAQIQTFAHQNTGHSQRFMGRTWLGSLPQGKYRLSFRIKWTKDKPDTAWRIHLYVDDVAEDRRLLTQYLASPNCWQEATDKFDLFLGPNWRTKRKKLASADEYRYYPVEFELKTGYVHANIIVDTNQEGKQKLYLDHVKTELLEPYTDKMQEKWTQWEKPGNLRGPRGVTPKKVLLVKGLYANQYAVDKAITCDAVYELPAKYEELYAYDAVTLANVDFTSTHYAQRRMLRDFVTDGGRLVILGGISTLGQGAMKHTYLEDLVPIQMRGTREIERCSVPLLLGPKPDVPYSDRPAVFWRHTIRFRPQTQILAYAGPYAIAGEQQFGNGRVVVFTGTVLGEETDGLQPFWQTTSWTKLISKMIGQ